MDHYFKIHRNSEEAKLKVAIIHLGGEALQLPQGCMKIQFQLGRTLSWSKYFVALQAQFDEELFRDPILEMKNLRQEWSFSKYQGKFDALLHRVQFLEKMSKRVVVSQFIGGLDLRL